MPLGGPDGGDGGDGGSVIVICDENINTLVGFQFKRRFVAGRGGDGAGRLKHGAKGIDIAVNVPVGTEVWIDGSRRRRLVDMLAHGQRAVVAEGGKGGRGNARFVSPTNRFPRVAEEGDREEELRLSLELTLLADVGIVGAPNAGKSSLLAAVSAARPRIAEYPFTSVEATLGVVDRHNERFVIVDIPGLIEGAHKGAGLGHQFLRHVERTRVLVHVLDGSADDVIGDYRTIRDELHLFDKELLKRPEIVAVNKVDLPGVRERCGEVQRLLEREVSEVHCISAVSRQGLDELVDGLLRVLAATPIVRAEAPVSEGGAPPVLRPRQRGKPEVVRDAGGAYVVSFRPAERLAAMVDGSNWDARVQLYDQLRRQGVIAALENCGIKPGEAFRVGALEWEWE